MFLKIADLKIGISPDYPYNSWPDKSFAAGINKHTDVSVRFVPCDHIEESDQKPFIQEGMIRWTHACEQEMAYSVYVNNAEKPDQIVYKLDISENWDQACIYFLDGYKDAIHPLKGYIGSLIFRNRLLFDQGIVIHASAIEHKRRGILFTAPSGTGKSTQAGLWQHFEKARIINDDTPAVRFIDARPYVFGTPWGGKSNIFLNEKVPLNSIYILQQAAQNSIRRLSGNEAAVLLMPRFFLPYYDEKIMNKAIDTVNMIIEKTPIYQFRCRPDAEAVEMVKQCVS